MNSLYEQPTDLMRPRDCVDDVGHRYVSGSLQDPAVYRRLEAQIEEAAKAHETSKSRSAATSHRRAR